MTKEQQERLEKCINALGKCEHNDVVEAIIDELEDTVAQCMLF